MSAERDVSRIVRSWIREDEHESADRVLQTVLSRLDTTPQRRSWWPSRRFAQMNRLTQAAVAAAAVLVVAVVGYNLLPRSGGVGGTPTATPTLAPTATPTPVPSITSLGSGPLQPGRYAWYWSGPRISFEVPSGWTGAGGTAISKGADLGGTPALAEIGWGESLPDSQFPVTHVYTDACHSEGALQPIGVSVADLVQALDDQASTDATITDVTLGGLPAKRVELVQSAGIDRATCRHGSEGPLQIWADAAETGYYALAPGHSGVVHVLDADGYRVIFNGAIGPDASTQDLAELEEIISSIEIAR